MSITGGPDIVENGLVVYLDASNRRSYPGSGTDWFDISGTNTSGSLTNGPAFSTDKIGVIDFDGTNDYASLGTFTNMGTTNRTYNVWCKIDTKVAGYRRILNFPADDTGTDTPTFTVGYSTGNTSLGIGGSPYDGYIDSAVGAAYLPTGEWFNLTATVTSKTVSFYKNAVFSASATSTGVVSTSPIGYIGRYNGTYAQNHDGQVALFMYYNRVLTASEILQNYNSIRSRFGV